MDNPDEELQENCLALFRWSNGSDDMQWIDATGHADALERIVDRTSDLDALGRCAFHIFKADWNILKVVDKTQDPRNDSTKSRMRQKIIESVANMVKSFVSSGHADLLRDSASEIKRVFKGVFALEKSNVVKAAAMQPVIEMLQAPQRLLEPEQFEPVEFVEKLLLSYSGDKKITAGVKGKILQMLGAIAQAYPEQIFSTSNEGCRPLSRQLKSLFLGKLRDSDWGDAKVIEGALRGITALTNHVDLSQEERGNLLHVVDRAVQTVYTSARYDVAKGGLEFLAAHSTLLADDLCMRPDIQLLEKVVYCCCHRNRDLRHLSWAALDDLLSSLCEALRNLEDRKRAYDICGAVVQFFFSILNSQRTGTEGSSAVSASVSCSIRALGLLAPAIQLLLPPHLLTELRSKLFVHTEGLFEGGKDALTDLEYQLTDLFIAIARILAVAPDVDATHIQHLDTLLEFMLFRFPVIYEKKRPKLLYSVLKVFASLKENTVCLRQLLDRFFDVGLRLSICENQVLLESEWVSDQFRSVSPELHHEYIPMWRKLLEPSPYDRNDAILPETLSEVLDLMYDTFMEKTLLILASFNLSWKSVNLGRLNAAPDDAVLGVSDTSQLEPVRPKDFPLFISMVELCKELLPKTSVARFSPWAPRFVTFVIDQSMKNPLVSGFYKLAKVALQRCSSLRLFDQAVDSLGRGEKILFRSLEQYILSVLRGLSQYKDELLVSCLDLVLEVPLSFVRAHAGEFVPPLQKALQLGLRHESVALVSLKACQRFLEHSYDCFEPYLSELLPWVSDYLGGNRDSPSTVEGEETTKASLSQRRRRSTAIRYSPVRPDIQLIAIRLLGKLGGCAHQAVRSIQSDEASGDASPSLLASGMRPSAENVLSLKLPFMQVSEHERPSVHLDSLVPRLLTLCETTTDRQTKIASCELLHALVLHMIGVVASVHPSSDRRDVKTSMYDLFARVFPVLLRLAVDVDKVTRQLFSTLVKQIVTWLTRYKPEMEDTLLLLDAVFDALANPFDAGLRYFAADCVSSFMKWTIKQSTEVQQAKNPINAALLLGNLYSCARHPNVHRRVGAALAFNALYAEMRESDAVIDKFTLEGADAFLSALVLCERDPPGQSPRKMIEASLKHIGRIIHERQSLLGKQNNDRVGTPPEAFVSLSVFHQHLFDKCADLPPLCILPALELFSRCVVSPERTLQTYEQNKPGFVQDLFEKQLRKCSSKVASLKTSAYEDVLRWMNALLVATRGYTWIVEDKGGGGLLFPDFVHVSSMYSDALSLFLRECLRPVPVCNDVDALSPTEKETLMELQTTNALDLVTLVNLVWAMGYGDRLMPSASDRLFYVLVTLLAVQPASIGISPDDSVLSHTIISTAKEFFVRAKANMTQKLRKDLRLTIRSVLKRIRFHEPLLAFSETYLATSSGVVLLEGLKTLYDTGFLEIDVTQLPDADLCDTFRDYDVRSLRPSQVLALHLAKAVFEQSVVSSARRRQSRKDNSAEHNTAGVPEAALKLSLRLGLPWPCLAELLFAQAKQNADKSEKNPGSMFYFSFSAIIVQHVAKMLPDGVEDIMKVSNQQPHALELLRSALVHHQWDDVDEMCSCVEHLCGHLPLVLHKMAATSKADSSTLSNVEDADESSAAPETGKAALLEVLTTILDIHPEGVLNDKQNWFHPVVSFFIECLSDKSNLLTQRQAVKLLPKVLKSKNLVLRDSVKKALDDMIAYQLGVIPSLKGTARTQASQLLSAFLSSLERCADPVLIRAAMALLNDPEHPVNSRFAASMKACASHAVVCGTHEDILNECFRLFSDNNETATLKEVAVVRIATVLLAAVSKRSHGEGAMMYARLMTGALGWPRVVEYAKQGDKVQDSRGSDLTESICAFSLLETMFSTLPYNVIKEKINPAYKNKDASLLKGNEFALDVARCGQSVRKTHCTLLPDCPESIRVRSDSLRLRQLAHRVVSAVIMNTQRMVKHFENFVFEKDASALDAVVDTTEPLRDLKAVTGFAIHRATLENLRSAGHAQSKLRGDLEAKSAEPHGTQKRFLASQYLAGTSLTQNMDDFGAARGLSQAPTTPGRPPRRFSGHSEEFGLSQGAMTDVVSRADDDSRDKRDQDQISYEFDSLNENPCMPVFLEAIDRCVKLEPLQARTVWMNAFLDKLESQDTHENIRLFITKMVLNRKDVFRTFAHLWMEPLMHVVIDGLGGDELHYLMRDVCLVVLEWTKELGQNPGRITGERFMASLFKRAYHEKNDVVKHNFFVIDQFVDCWKGKVDFPKKEIIAMTGKILKSKSNYSSEDRHVYDMEVRRRIVYLNLLSVLVMNGLPAHDDDKDAYVPKESFFKRLVGNLLHDSKLVYRPTAEICGKIIRQGQLRNDHDEGGLDGLFVGILKETLSKMSTDSGRTEQFINCVQLISLQAPAVVEQFLSDLVVLLRRKDSMWMQDTGKALLLSIAVSCGQDRLLQLFNELRDEYEDIVRHPNRNVQVLAIKMLHKTAMQLPLQIVEKFYLTLSPIFPYHKHEECRQAFFLLSEYLYDNIPEFRNAPSRQMDTSTLDITGTETSVSSVDFSRMHNELRSHLVAATLDSSQVIRDWGLEFWSKKQHITDDPVDRLLGLFHVFYTPAHKSEWTGQACSLLLRLTGSSEKYDDKLHAPLIANDSFKELKFDTSASGAGFTISTPLFAASLQDDTRRDKPENADGADDFITEDEEAEDGAGGIGAYGGLVRATAERNFAPTMTQDSLAVPPAGVSQSSLLFTPNPAKAGNTENNNRNAAGQMQHPTWKPRRFRDRSEVRGSQAIVAKQLRLKRKELYWKRMNGGDVSLFRSYRQGEMPDVCIKYSDILKPLTALATLDDQLSVSLFEELFRAVMELAKCKNVDMDKLRRGLKKGLGGILSTVGDAHTLASTLLRIASSYPEIAPRPEVLGKACITSLSYYSGVLALEDVLLWRAEGLSSMFAKGDEDARSAKRQRVSRSDQSDFDLRGTEEREEWRQLADVYRCLGETDYVGAIWMNWVGASEETMKALNLELNCRDEEASQMYKELISTKSNANAPWEVSRWQEGLVAASRRLLMWDDLSERYTLDLEDTNNSLLDDDQFGQDRLSYALESRLKLGGEKRAEVLEFVSDVLHGAFGVRWQHRLVKQQGYLVSLACMQGGKADLAKTYVRECLAKFSSDWGRISAIATRSRHSWISQLLPVCDLDTCVTVLTTPSDPSGALDTDGRSEGNSAVHRRTSRGELTFLDEAKETDKAVVRLMSAWSRRNPSETFDDSLTWDNVVHVRTSFLERLANQGDQMNDSAFPSSLALRRAVVHREAAQSLYHAGWHTQGYAHVKLAKAWYDQAAPGKKSNDLFLLLVQTKRRMRESEPSPTEKAMESCKEELKQINTRLGVFSDAITDGNVDLIRTQMVLEVASREAYLATTEHVAPEVAIRSFEDVLARFEALRNEASSSGSASAPAPSSRQPSSAPVTLLASASDEYGVVSLKQSVRQAQQEAYLRYATFCEEMLKQSKKSQTSTAPSPPYASLLVKCILRALFLGSASARQWFPQSLYLAANDIEARKMFGSEAAHVPSVEMVTWATPMVANLAGDAGEELLPVLIKMAKLFPSSVFFPYLVSEEVMRRSPSTAVKERFRILYEEISNPIMERFVEEVDELVPLQVRLSGFRTELQTILLEEKENQENSFKLWKETVKKSCFGERSRVSWDRFKSSLRREMAREFENKVVSQPLSEVDRVMKTMKTISDAIQEQEARLSDRNLSHVPLKSLSPWLSSFAPVGEERTALEVPGQDRFLLAAASTASLSDHTDTENRLRSKRVHVLGFEPSVLVLQSKQRPKRLSMRGDDLKQHDFLVKGGEDLRLDQRIEMVFDLANQIFRHDHECSRRSLRIKTFRVIPMSPRHGLFEWISKTKEVGQMIEDEIQRRAPPTERGKSLTRRVMECMRDNLYATAGKMKKGVLQQQACLNLYEASDSDVIRAFEKGQSMLPYDLLRMGVQLLARSPEAYFALRQNFAKTLSAFSITSYMLGVGDRHLANYLFDQKDGGVVGIDFGYSFGIALQLPVPELPPFRLSRQMSGVLQPLGHEGMLRTDMVHCLRALNENRLTVLNVLKLFITEPLIAWDTAAHRKTGGKASSDRRARFSQDTLAICERKLACHHPSAVLSDDFQRLFLSPKATLRNGVLRVLRGDRRSVRASIPHDGPRAYDEVVDCLVELASSPDVIARNWTGHSPWL